MVHNTWDPLVDGHGRPHTYLRVSLTDRCNFRCVYCMPEDGVVWQDRKDILTLEEIERLVNVFARLGVNKVRLTGGEPTVRRGFLDLVPKLSRIAGIETLLMTTNGTRLREYAPALRRAGLTGVNVSLDTLRADRFLQITRRDALGEVLDGIDAAVAAGLNTKVNVVVMPGQNDDELGDLVEFVKDRPVQMRFIEFMPFLGNQWQPDRIFGYADMRARLDPHFELKKLPGQESAVAQEFSIDGFQGTIGFITSMTDSFCSTCNRIRLTADGSVKTCLFLPPRKSLRDMMRAGCPDEDLAVAIREDLMTKWAGHPSMHAWRQLDNLSMVQIGG